MPLKIIEHIFQGLDATLLEKITEVVYLRTLSKGEYFLKEGQMNSEVAFVYQGLLQSFCNKDAEEITTYLAGPGKIAISLSSFLTQSPSKENIRALSESSIACISKESFSKLIEQDSSFKQFYIATLEHQIICIEESRRDFITLSAQERYIKLLRDEMDVLQMFPAKYIAATLGITERQLSRIRKSILKQKL